MLYDIRHICPMLSGSQDMPIVMNDIGEGPTCGGFAVSRQTVALSWCGGLALRL
jgi:hypothetical protein